MKIVAGIDIGNATTETALARIDGTKAEFLASGTVSTTGIKGTRQNINGVVHSLTSALEKTGIDLLDISGGFCRYVRPGCKEQGYFSEMAKAVKAAVHIPVLVAGGVVEANFAEQLLQDKRADLIGVGRAVMKDSLWAKKAVESLQ